MKDNIPNCIHGNDNEHSRDSFVHEYCGDCPFEDDPYVCTIPDLLHCHPEIRTLLIDKSKNGKEET